MGVGQVARVLIRDLYIQGCLGRLYRQRRQELRDVLNHATEPLRLFVVRRIVTQQVAILLHGCAAPSRRCDDRIHSRSKKRIDVSAGHVSGRVLFTSMGVQGATAPLIGWYDDLAAVARQHPDGGLHRRALYQRHDTAR